MVVEPRPPPPPRQAISGHLRSFLDRHFNTPSDLQAAAGLAAALEKDCRVLDDDLAFLAERHDAAIRAWSAPLEEARVIINDERSKLYDSSGRFVDGGDGVGRVLEVELKSLAKEIRWIGNARLYAETSLNLEALVGDLEDAVLSKTTISINDYRYKQEKIVAAIKVIKDIEEILVRIVKSGARWSCLITAVDSRVQKSLAVLRPQILQDYRAILSSIGWPPSLSSNSGKGSAELPNPLVLMLEDQKQSFSQRFLDLCSLQQLQACRDIRQCNYLEHRDGVSHDFVEVHDVVCNGHNLWTIDELVFSLASRMEHHFSMWSKEPKFIFALVYKITRDFSEGIENVLQPLIDKVRLVGYSAKEAWVLTMAKMLSEYLISKVFPDLAKEYDACSETSDVVSSWLHLIDLVISFDKRMLNIATSGVIPKGVPSNFARNPLPMLLYLIFHEHYDWLQMWAEIELRYAEESLRSELEDEAVWEIVINKESKSIYETEGEIFLCSTREDHKAPPFAESIVKIAWTMIEKCKLFPNLSMRLHFLKSSACVLLHWFYQVLLLRCQVVDPTTAIMGNEILQRVVGSINAARYCESTMREWSEDTSLIELSIFTKNVRKKDKEQIIFHNETKTMVRFGTDRLMDIISSLLHEFEFLSTDYIQNSVMNMEDKEITELEMDAASNVGQISASNTLIEPLDMLKERLETLKSLLNFTDFADYWRSSASGLDHFIFNSIILNNVKYSSFGVYQFKVDMRTLFIVFKPFCARPEAFFPYISDSIKLLDMSWEDSKQLIEIQSQDEKKIRDHLRVHGVTQVSPSNALTILNNRIFTN